MAVKPPRLTHSSIIRSLPWRRLTSVRTKQPVFNVSPSGSSRSPRTRFAPSAAKRSALARPMPLAAPVITAAFPARRPGLTVGTEALARGAEALDAELDHVAVGEEARRLLAESHAGRRAGRDHVAGEERHELADIAHEGRDVEDQVLSRARLLGLAIDLEPHGEVMHVGNLVGRREKRAERREGIAALAFHPLAAALELEGPFRIVVVQDVTGDVIERGVPLDVACKASDHDRELHLPVGLGAALGDDDV